MSVISTFYDRTFSISRKSAGAGANANLDVYSALSSGNKGCLQSVTDQAQLYDKENFGKEYNLYCDDSVAIDVSDKVVFTDMATTEFVVKAVLVRRDIDDYSESYKQVVLVKTNSKGDVGS